MVFNKIIFKGVLLYFFYIFMFAIVLFFVQKQKKYKQANNEQSKVKKKTNSDRVALIESGKDGILVRLNLIKNAQKKIDVSYYTLQEGDSTKVLLGSLIDAADRGVKVRILLDGIFHNLKKDLKAVVYGFYIHPNIDLKIYESFKLFKPRTWNDRLHDKLIIIDDNLAIIGGRNIGDKYFVKNNDLDNYSKDRDVVIFANQEFADTSIKAMQEYYNSVFDYKYSKPIINKISKRKKKQGLSINKVLADSFINNDRIKAQTLTAINWLEKTQATSGVEFIYNPIGRGNQDPWILRRLLNLAKQAQETVLVQSPYVIPSSEILNKMKTYQLDTSKITVLTNSIASSPNLIALGGYVNSKEKIVDSGVNIYEYQGRKSLHGKTYIYDGKITAIGSFNLDARSSYINSEIMVIIDSEDFAKKLEEYVKVDIENSFKVHRDYTYIENPKVKALPVSNTKLFSIKFLSKLTYFLDYLL